LGPGQPGAEVDRKARTSSTPAPSAARASSTAAPSATREEDDDKPGESPFELRDVPYVQYFEGGYALHAAYWHDAFGTARSHGCINLSPIDARRVFLFTEPAVPDGWHGVSIPVGQGTLVVVHK
jgi:lipoprotein-anchoring transpeptidase ErfK/SrfK